MIRLAGKELFFHYELLIVRIYELFYYLEWIAGYMRIRTFVLFVIRRVVTIHVKKLCFIRWEKL